MPLNKLGDISVEDFLAHYWQKQPLLIRQAYPDFQSPIDGNDLAGLSLEEDAEARLILEHGTTPWELRHGPFDENTYQQLPKSHWTLLVQAVDQWVPDVRDLLDDFRFIPNWRLDDIMVSYAADQGSVGPHFDYYDVFLLQGQGKRRWQVGQSCDSQSPRIEGAALRILKDFEPEHDWILEPGDMLYLPPGIAHWGTAQGDDCLTYSIGFRAPSHADILCELAQDIASHLTEDQRYGDPGLTLGRHPGEIPASAIDTIRAQLLDYLSHDRIGDWLGRYMTERKYPDQDQPEQYVDAEHWQEDRWQPHPATRLASRTVNTQTWLYADGERFACTEALAERLCQMRPIEGRELAALASSEALITLVETLIERGILVDEEDELEC
ncbi:cupin domain-containing protein [Marinimicrobium alkaliphilum]|uniref:cupin domain-containing protein n=1 Tax=Marinimicrobium alkaliphilum TaxID=2202654 RepID=UPI000DBAA90B|nr:cupin domain-containing protein [Marinimicrobium alkaliphilum]